MFDGSVDTCWNSDGSDTGPQHILIDFGSQVVTSSLTVMFQGGFVGQDCTVDVGAAVDGLLPTGICFESIEDTNDEQTFPLELNESFRFMRINFASSTDFYGRITIYKLEVKGHPVWRRCESKTVRNTSIKHLFELSLSRGHQYVELSHNQNLQPEKYKFNSWPCICKVSVHKLACNSSWSAVLCYSLWNKVSTSSNYSIPSDLLSLLPKHRHFSKYLGYIRFIYVAYWWT